jgi:RNA recognition motif-containing protein
MSKLTKFFVGNLPWTVSSRELRKYFASFGHVATADVLFDHSTGLSKGYGFVQFSTTGGYQSVLKNDKHELDGQTLILKTADIQ